MEKRSILPPQWQVPPEFRARLGTNVGRQRPMVAEGHLLLVLHAPPSVDNHKRAGRFFWRSPDGTWTSNKSGTGIQTLNLLLDEYEKSINQLDEQEHASNSANAYFDVLERLTPIYRAAQNLSNVLQEARKSCPEFEDLINVRDRAYTIQREAELLFSGTQNSLDSIVAKRAEEQAQASHQMATSAHRLNTLAAFFFPIITLTAILSVDLGNVANVFGIDHESKTAQQIIPFVFIGLILVGFAAGTVLTRIVNKNPPSSSGMN